MSDDRRLKERLSALAASGISGEAGRVIRAPDPEALLYRVLAELDGTVMPRLLRLAPRPDRFVVLEVANRRLLRITAGSGDAALSALIGSDFTNDPGDDGPALAQMFRALVDGVSEVTLLAESLEHRLDPEKAGVSARRLAQLLELPQPAPLAGPAEVVDAFLASLKGAAVAWRMDTGEGTESAGDDAALAALEEASASLPEPGGAAWSFLALSEPDQPHGLTVIADLGDLRLILAVPAESLGRVADAWRSAVVPVPSLTGQ